MATITSEDTKRIEHLSVQMLDWIGSGYKASRTEQLVTWKEMLRDLVFVASLDNDVREELVTLIATIRKNHVAEMNAM